MVARKKIKDVTIQLMIFLVLINLMAYFIVGESSYYFQDILSKKVQGAKNFAILDEWALLIIGLILVLNFLPKMASMQYQKYLLLLLCGISPFIPMTDRFYPLISGVSNVIDILTNAWIQLFCPTAIRGTIAGILTASNGLQDILDTSIENFRVFDIEAIHTTGLMMFFLAMGLIWKLKKLSPRDFVHHINFKPMKINQLMVRYLFIFLSCVLVGINDGVFYYTFNDAIMILPQEQPEKFQYMVNIVSIFSPFVFGFVTDKLGYMKTQMRCFYLITIVHFFNFLIKAIGIGNIYILYFLSFLDCIFANCLEVSIIAICGYYFLNQGIFRSFALYGILYNLGNFFCDLIFAKFSSSFAHYQLSIAVINVLGLVIISKSFKNFQKQQILI